MHRRRLNVTTLGRGLYPLSHQLRAAIASSGIITGLCNVFVHHTSASLILCENADPSVQTDLETFLARLVPDGDPMWTHRYEGPDDMPAHVRTVLTQTSVTIPVEAGQSSLGTWQGLYLWEHRTHGHERNITITTWGQFDP